MKRYNYRFTSKNIILFLNRYNYVQNQPLYYIDSDGDFPWALFGAVGASFGIGYFIGLLIRFSPELKACIKRLKNLKEWYEDLIEYGKLEKAQKVKSKYEEIYIKCADQFGELALRSVANFQL